MQVTLPDQSAVLMIGSPGIGMLEFCIALSEGYLEKDDAIVFVAMDTSPADVIAMMETFGLPMQELLGKRIFFLDYHSCLLGTNMDRVGDQLGVRTISDLEGIMFNIAAIADETGKRVRIFFHSLSTLFLYNQANVVLKFFQITCSRIRAQYGTAIVAVHEGVHDERTVNHLMAIADGTVELRFDEDLNKMMRIRNMRGYPTSPNWIPFEIKNLSKNEDVRLLEWI
ncbi:MAG: RAD55 family ATPase [Methanomassiliicoccales archaeon]|nr:RAD55 family ATPase [Methanomassiliicoccales archaeon]